MGTCCASPQSAQADFVAERSGAPRRGFNRPLLDTSITYSRAHSQCVLDCIRISAMSLQAFLWIWYSKGTSGSFGRWPRTAEVDKALPWLTCRPAKYNDKVRRRWVAHT